jgi:salicylate synthetase
MAIAQSVDGYKLTRLEGNFHLHGTLHNLREAGHFLNGYMVYEKEGEVRIVFGEYARLILSDSSVTITEQSQSYTQSVMDPFKQMEAMLSRLSLKEWTAYGYIAFDTVRHYYHYDKQSAQPDLHFMVPRTEVILNARGATVRSLDDAASISARLTGQYPVDPASLQSNISVEINDKEAYKTAVSTLIDAIQNECLTKAILSRKIEIEGDLNVLATYHLGTHLNNSARSYAFELDEVKAVGLSPEILLYAENGKKIITNPLAGTRPRGQNQEEDARLRRELHHTPKEVKEHALSVWLAQEEIGSLCKPESVHVYNFLEVKTYRCVQHLSSRVCGTLRKDNTVYDAIRVLFPGITVSGISKKESISWIDRLEEKARGIYAGAIGWIDAAGNADLAIAIRSVYQYGQRVVLNAGAGIVQESDPDFEYTETCNKMNTIQKAIIMR